MLRRHSSFLLGITAGQIDNSFRRSYEALAAFLRLERV
jgi:hypothetical protein